MGLWRLNNDLLWRARNGPAIVELLIIHSLSTVLFLSHLLCLSSMEVDIGLLSILFDGNQTVLLFYLLFQILKKSSHFTLQLGVLHYLFAVIRWGLFRILLLLYLPCN